MSGLDKTTHSIFEIIGSYFVDTYFNHIYNAARLNVKDGNSLTDTYVASVNAYTVGIQQNKDCYADVVRGVFTYFTSVTRFSAISFPSFVNRMTEVCVPADQFKSLSDEERDTILCVMLTDLVSNLSVCATHPDMLKKIIDEHVKNSSVTIRMLQDTAVDILATKRSLLYNKFMGKVAQARTNVSPLVVENMKLKIHELVAQNCKLSARLSEAAEREKKLLKVIELLKKQQPSAQLRQLQHSPPPAQQVQHAQQITPKPVRISPIASAWKPIAAPPPPVIHIGSPEATPAISNIFAMDADDDDATPPATPTPRKTKIVSRFNDLDNDDDSNAATRANDIQDLFESYDQN